MGQAATYRATPSRRAAGPARRFLRAEDGAALVEFALVLPMMLIVFAVIIEGSRLMHSFQTAIGGVRDATRFLARVVPADICTTGGSVAGHTAQLQAIVGQSLSGNPVFPIAVTVNSVTPSVTCVVGAYRVNPAPVANVSANVTVAFPFASVFSLIGASPSSLTTTVTDSSRVFGT